MNTRIFETTNPELKPSENLKIEAGLIFKIKKVTGSITAFKERLSNGFDFASHYLFLNYNKYQTDGIPSGTKPDPNTLTKVPSQVPVYFQMPVNNQESYKSGVEFNFNFGKINPLYTSITLDGAWLRTKRISSTIPYQFQPDNSTANPDLFVGFYPAGESKISERLNTNLRMVTQIPKLRLVLSTTAQVIWYDMYYYPSYDDAPMYLLYSNGSKVEFTPEMRKKPEYVRYVDSKNPSYFRTEIMPPLLQTNFRLSKEIYEKVKLSVYVNNLVNYRPEYEYTRSGSFIKRNPSVYFGAEIKVML
jgi:hypothetical protein